MSLFLHLAGEMGSRKYEGVVGLGEQPSNYPLTFRSSFLLLPPPPLFLSLYCSAQVQSFVDGLFDMSRDLKAYKHHLRDFLVQVLEFGSDEGGAEALYNEEKAEKAAEDLERRKAVPGLLNPYQQEDMDDL